MKQAIIRLYRPEDASAVEHCFIELQAFERCLEPNRVNGHSIAARYLRQLLDRCEETAGATFVAEDDGSVVGFVAVFVRMDSESLIEATTDYAYISDLVVLPEYRGRGIGRALLQRAEAHAQEQGAAVLKVDVLVANTGALDLYRTVGFQDHELRLSKQLQRPISGT